MKKVCFVTTSPLIVNFFLMPHLLHLRSRYDISLVVTLPGEVPLREVPGVHIEAIEIPRKIDPWRDLSALLRLQRFYRSRRFDLVHSFAPKAGLLSTWAGTLASVPVRVHTYTGQVWAARRGPMRTLLRAADRSIARRATLVLADSPSQCTFLASEGIVDADRCRVLGAGSVCGVDPVRFRPNPQARAEVRGELGIAEAVPLVLYLGRVTRDKGVGDLVKAFNRLRTRVTDAVLLVVGPDEDGLEAQCGNRGQVRFAGYTDAPERYIAAADLLCLPSYREGFGSVVVEAAAAGVPAVASRIYGIVDAVVDGETGLLFEAGNVDELEFRLRRLLADAELRAGMGAAARSRALAEFSQDRLVNALETCYREALGG